MIISPPFLKNKSGTEQDYGWISRMMQNIRLKNFSSVGKRPAIIDDPQKVTASAYNRINSSAFYIFCFRNKTVKVIDKDQPENSDNSIVIRATIVINGGTNGLLQRQSMAEISMSFLNDKV